MYFIINLCNIFLLVIREEVNLKVHLKSELKFCSKLIHTWLVPKSTLYVIA